MVQHTLITIHIMHSYDELFNPESQTTPHRYKVQTTITLVMGSIIRYLS